MTPYRDRQESQHTIKTTCKPIKENAGGFYVSILTSAGAQSVLQEFINTLKVIQGVIDEEAEFWDYAELVVYSVAQFEAHLFDVLVDVR